MISRNKFVKPGEDVFDGAGHQPGQIHPLPLKLQAEGFWGVGVGEEQQISDIFARLQDISTMRRNTSLYSPMSRSLPRKVTGVGMSLPVASRPVPPDRLPLGLELFHALPVNTRRATVGPDSFEPISSKFAVDCYTCRLAIYIGICRQLFLE